MSIIIVIRVPFKFYCSPRTSVGGAWLRGINGNISRGSILRVIRCRIINRGVFWNFIWFGNFGSMIFHNNIRFLSIRSWVVGNNINISIWSSWSRDRIFSSVNYRLKTIKNNVI